MEVRVATLADQVRRFEGIIERHVRQGTESVRQSLRNVAKDRDWLREHLSAFEAALNETIPRVKADVDRLRKLQEERMRLEEGQE
jgi:hypothetical protein